MSSLSCEKSYPCKAHARLPIEITQVARTMSHRGIFRRPTRTCEDFVVGGGSRPFIIAALFIAAVSRIPGIRDVGWRGLAPAGTRRRCQFSYNRYPKRGHENAPNSARRYIHEKNCSVVHRAPASLRSGYGTSRFPTVEF